MNAQSGRSRVSVVVVIGLALVALAAIGLAQGGGLIGPLQSPVDTPALVPTREPPTPTPADEPTATPTVTPTITLTPTPGPSPTPDIPATSQSVIATITALAATPTYPPTDTPRPRRTPIISGPGDTPPGGDSAGGITVQTLSEQVFAGGTAVLTIRAQPGARCVAQIARDDNGMPSLEPIPDAPVQTAGRNGIVAWIWTVDRDEPAGIMRLNVDCGSVGVVEVRMRVAAE